MEQKFCQSCGMPLSDATVLGTETNGSKMKSIAVIAMPTGTLQWTARWMK